MLRITFLSLLFLLFGNVLFAQETLTSEEQAWMKKASKEYKNGWLWLKTKGAPFERGFQHGYLSAKEYAEAIRVYKAMTYHSYGMDYSFFVNSAARMHKDKITPELIEEMKGIAAGFTKAGVPSTLDDIIGWNAYIELTGYWWPNVQSIYRATAPFGTFSKGHCSGFIATGSATKDGKIVIGHETFTEFWNGQYNNFILDITPEDGYRMVMQGCPGYIASMTDFWVTSAGLVITETSIVGFQSYDTTKVPEYVRARNACQYAKTIDEWVEILNAKNNGGYANMWLIGDINTNEIADYEQGLIYQSLKKTNDGYFFGDNAPDDPRIRNLECTDVGYDDVRQQTGARRVRWPQLLNQHYGKIDVNVGMIMLGDTYDVYLNRIEPSSRTICSHYDVDPQFYVSDPNAVWNVPYYPAGSIDGKVTSSDLAKEMDMWGIFGRADGIEFNAEEFLRIHPQWNWQEGYLISRPHQPWTLFTGN